MSYKGQTWTDRPWFYESMVIGSSVSSVYVPLGVNKGVNVCMCGVC